MKKIIYEMLRKYVARIATGKKGKCEILDKEIICYVDGRKLKKKKKYDHRYDLSFLLIPAEEELYRIYRVDKPVHYIVKNVVFDMEVNIKASVKNCHVTFDNCTFKEGIGIDFADHITFINNKYVARDHKNYFSLVPEDHFYISTRANKNEINKISFISDNIEVDDINIIPVVKANDVHKKINRKKRPIIKLWLYAKEISIFNTNVFDIESIVIVTDRLTLNHTNISSRQIEIDAKYMTANCDINSEIISISTNPDAIIPGKMNVNHECMFINGVEVDKNEKVINEYDLELQKQRLELINSLRKIKNISDNHISDRLETVKSKMEEEQIKKLIRKK